jgi:hypothetical protein
MTELRATVRMHQSMWIAECPRRFCGNAEMFGQCRDGTVGGLSGTSFRCRPEYGGCGLVCGADWPPNVADIEWVLMQRPVPGTRNWLPTEDLHDLLSENLKHGILPVSQAALDATDHPGGALLQIVGDHIEGGALTAATWRHEIGGRVED